MLTNSIMKKLIYLIACVTLLSGCGLTKNSGSVVISREEGRNLEGDKVMIETVQLHGIEMVETLNAAGNDIIKRPYKWWAGTATADNRQIAIEMAQSEAYSTISRVLNNAVVTSSERGAIANQGRVQMALKSYWEQVSTSLQRAGEPVGQTIVEYNRKTKMYTVTAKVGVSGEQFNALLEEAGNFRPSDLNETELQEFIQVNNDIIEAARGN